VGRIGRRKIPTGTPLPKALACGMLEDDGRILFLIRKDLNGNEKLELPCIIVPSGRSPVAEIKEAFRIQSGIDGEIQEIIHEFKFNAGSRRRKSWIPCLVFKVVARERRAKPSSEFSGFKWMAIEKAKKERLSRKSEFLIKMRKA